MIVARLIDANVLMKILEKELDMNVITDWGIGYIDAIHNAMEDVEFMPTVEIELVRHGKWLKFTDNGIEYQTCSECNYDMQVGGADSWCPACGSIMDGE